MFGFVNPKPQYRAYAAILLPIPSVFFPAWTVRAAILLLVPGTASLTLDSDGFAINQCCGASAHPGRDVSISAWR